MSTITTTTFPFTGFDVETKPLPHLVERYSKEFPDFDQTAVKTGNLKDPAKIAEKINQSRLDHENDRIAYWANLREKAALNPFTAQIIVIGLIAEGGEVEFLEGPEHAIFTEFWRQFEDRMQDAAKWVFWSGCGATEKNFDLDFIVTRSRILGVKIPPQVRNGRFYSDRFVDLAKTFLLYQRESYLSLTKAADLLGLYGTEAAGSNGTTIWPKSEGDPVKGENFWQWYEGTAQSDHPKEAQRQFALKYLKNDLLHLLHLTPRIL